MNTYELKVTDRSGQNGGFLTVRAKTIELATSIAVNKGYQVMSCHETTSNEDSIQADAEYDRMKRAVFIGTLQAHIVLIVAFVVLLIVAAMMNQ